MESKVYIIIVTYNGMKWINDCLLSCKGHNVIVIDNASSDNTTSFIKKNFPQTILIPQNENLGFGQANNIGISYALKQGADFVFLLNQDAYLNENCIQNLIKVYRENQDYGILSPIHLNGKGTKLDKNFSFYLTQEKNDQFLFDAVKSIFKDIYEVPFVNAAAWLIPKATLGTIGGFDPIFYHYGEDDNYCQRVLFHGMKIGFVPNSFVLHDRENRPSQPTLEFSENYFKEKEREYKWLYANVLLEKWKQGIDEEISKLLKLFIKSMVFLRFNNAIGYSKQIKLLKKIINEIKISREKNKLKKSHYLNF